MCVAACIFNKVSREYLDAMHKDNPDGGGVAWVVGGQLRFARGLDAEGIHTMQEQGQITLPYLLHFRWATHGDKVPELTHPFPIGPRALMGELKGVCDRLLIHNGTWGGYWSAVKKTNQDTLPPELLGCQSDTAIAAWLAQDNESLLDDVAWATAVGFVTNGALDVTTRGRWYDKDGNWYSNLSWVPTAYSAYSWGQDDYLDYFRKKEAEQTKPYHYSENWDEWAERYHTAGQGAQSQTDTQKLAALAKKHEERRAEIARKAENMRWDEYLRAKYGGEAIDEDVVSEDPALVNSILARHMLP